MPWSPSLCRDLDAAAVLPPAVAHSVLVATRAFVSAEGRTDDAARQAGPTLMRLGRRAAVRGHSAGKARPDLQRVLEDRARLADPVIARVRPAEQRDAIRCRLRQFLHQIHHAALAGHRQAHTMMALAPKARRDMVSRALFASESVPEEPARPRRCRGGRPLHAGGLGRRERRASGERPPRRARRRGRADRAGAHRPPARPGADAGGARDQRALPAGVRRRGRAGAVPPGRSRRPGGDHLDRRTPHLVRGRRRRACCWPGVPR
ncbi:hypothetical protein G5V59_11960 [Nocardioides sp. W3-2-3]|uniref:hypothetical protein n=1 Tax=Nocardioides convexus TaxID=2712224 RepID=UPI0024185D27|nr:hypothetical protein [Nocardioides convexus]NHA00505.1 hypothetical protein [Nocardioides convexus]